MKEFLINFGRRYAAVSTNDDKSSGAGATKKQNKTKKHKSLQSKPGLTGGLTILDSFFHQREAGKRARWPKCKQLLRNFFFIFFLSNNKCVEFFCCCCDLFGELIKNFCV